MKKNLKNSSFLIVIFFTISLFSLLTIYFLEKSINLRIGEDSFLSDNSIKFNCEKVNKMPNSDILLNLGKDYTVLKESNGFSLYKAIFFNGKLNNKPQMLEGRFFKKDDFNKHKKYIIIGKNLTKNIMKEDGKKYYYIENEYYEVIGIMGEKNKETSYDNTIYINLDSLLTSQHCFLDGNFIIDKRNKSEELYNSLKNKYKKIGIKINKVDNSTGISDIVRLEINETTENIIEVVGILVINTLLVTRFWINKQKKELGVRRILGSSKIKITLKIIGRLLIISTISYICGYLTFIIISYLIDGYFCFYTITTVIVYLITIISALIASIIPIIKSNKMQISEVIK